MTNYFITYLIGVLVNHKSKSILLSYFYLNIHNQLNNQQSHHHSDFLFFNILLVPYCSIPTPHLLNQIKVP